VRRAAAMIRLADLRVRQGRLEEAAQLLERLEQHPNAVGTLAALHLARGELALGRDLLERTPEAQTMRSRRSANRPWSDRCSPSWSMSTSKKGTSATPSRSPNACVVSPGRNGGPNLRAVAALAKGRAYIATGAGRRTCLHEAMEGFTAAQLPMELALTRLEMARALLERSPEVAVAHAKAALEDFERLDAARHADAAAALLRSLGAPIRTGPKGIGALTRRETEILQLVGAGLSNPEIGHRLYISRKTVETHVGNLLSKLGLRNRAEVAAYAARQQISSSIRDFPDTPTRPPVVFPGTAWIEGMGAMRYKLLGPSGLRVSELCLGTMSFGETPGASAPTRRRATGCSRRSQRRAATSSTAPTSITRASRSFLGPGRDRWVGRHPHRQVHSRCLYRPRGQQTCRQQPIAPHRAQPADRPRGRPYRRRPRPDLGAGSDGLGTPARPAAHPDRRGPNA
jgi:DNA-binding NarL/FixJ family response regulator